MTTIALIISILGLVLSFFLVGGIICAFTLVWGIKLFLRERSIAGVRVMAISLVGVILPFIMYFNTFGFSLPDKDPEGRNVFVRILYSNYLDRGGVSTAKGSKNNDTPDDTSQKADENAPAQEASLEEAADEPPAEEMAEPSGDEMVYVNSEDKSSQGGSPELNPPTESIFESLDSIRQEDRNKGGIISVGASDDDMPSYGGLPVGTLLIAQYFREDDHNCNPVLVLQNKSGEAVRYECVFKARNAAGDELARSEKTVEVVRDGSLFVFEGRFDKRELGGNIPDAYEFSITKREPYEKDMSRDVSVYTATNGACAFLTAENESSVKVKVDAYVLFFDGKELVDCMWMIPQNTDEVCLDPGSGATIRGDAYYRFDRVETFYTAYEAVGEEEDDAKG